LQAYAVQYGDCLVPRAHDKVLSTWVDTQRATNRAGTIPSYRRARLDALGFVWDTSALKEQHWNDMFERLLQYKVIYGSTTVPRHYEEDPALAAWVDRNRQNCTREDRMARLGSIGFAFSPCHRSRTSAMATDDKWQEMFDTLQEYKRFYGDCFVPRDFEHFPSLGIWVDKQRAAYRGNVLAVDRAAKLEAIGLSWDPSAAKKEEAWDAMLEKLIAYKASHGDCNVPRHYKLDPSLGGWVGRNRHLGRLEGFSEERKKKLDAVGFNWGDALEKGVWSSQFKKLVAFHREFGHCRVPLGFKSDQSLANWVKYQRQRDKMGLMDADQRVKLNSLNFSWCRTLQPKKTKQKGTKKSSKATAAGCLENTSERSASKVADSEFITPHESATMAARSESNASGESATKKPAERERAADTEGNAPSESATTAAKRGTNAFGESATIAADIECNCPGESATKAAKTDKNTKAAEIVNNAPRVGTRKTLQPNDIETVHV
jgi:hypothetical protein